MRRQWRWRVEQRVATVSVTQKPSSTVPMAALFLILFWVIFVILKLFNVFFV
jgi:hypothetical protein